MFNYMIIILVILSNVKSFCVLNSNIEVFNDFIKIKNEKNTSFSSLINLAIVEYTKNHKKSNKSNILDYINSNFIKLPNFYDHSLIWRDYCIKTSEKNLKDIELQSKNINIVSNFLLKFSESERKHKKSINLIQMLAYHRSF